jgi:NAD(P)H-dependent FMN reductase
MATAPLRFLAIAGSVRAGSYNRRLLAAAAALAPEGIAVDVHDELAALPFFDEDLEGATAGGPPAVRALRDAVRRADGLVIATPEYNHSIPGVLKNGLDWLSRPGPDEVLAGKPVAILGATVGRWGTRLAQSQLRQVLAACEALVLPAPSVFIADAPRVFDADGRLRDASTIAAIRALLVALARWCGEIRRSANVVAGSARR